MKLKDCPFCGGEPGWCGDMPKKDDHICHLIKCSECNITFDADDNSLAIDSDLSEFKALMASKWNKRN